MKFVNEKETEHIVPILKKLLLVLKLLALATIQKCDA